MTVVILSPRKVIIAGLVSALLICASILGVLALAGVFHSEQAQAYGAEGVGAKNWYFAEGYTGPGFEEWILIYNPPGGAIGGSGNAISPQIRMYGNAGEIGGYNLPRLEPGQRTSIDINEIAASYGYAGDVSIYIQDPDYPFICERALYFNYKGQVTGGSQAFGYQEGANE
jgi:hypothetical protein